MNMYEFATKIGEMLPGSGFDGTANLGGALFTQVGGPRRAAFEQRDNDIKGRFLNHGVADHHGIPH
jgi:hypothetical protein